MLNQVGEFAVGNGFDLTQWRNHLIFVGIVLVRLMSSFFFIFSGEVKTFLTF